MPLSNTPIPPAATACLLLADGKRFFGEAIGAPETVVGELCFNTGMTGYQEILTDPSYAGQIITFTFPHIGNVGCNDEDNESAPRPGSARLGATGLVVREPLTPSSNFRAQSGLNAWLTQQGISGICGVDTRALTRYVRERGAQNAMIFRLTASSKGLAEEEARLAAFPSMDGMELAAAASTKAPYAWTQGTWKPFPQFPIPNPQSHYHVVAIDYGEKLNILRLLVERGCQVTVVPAQTSAQDILAYKPDGVFLSNGPGDPAATGIYAVPVIRQLMDAGIPLFGICLGHQLLGLALGGKTAKLALGHRGANQPVKNLETGKVEITSQNHGFAVLADSLPANVKITHLSLFDNTLEGLRCTDKPVFAVQYHPESSPGPHDSQYLFDEFVAMMGK